MTIRLVLVRNRSVGGGAERSLAAAVRRLPEVGVEPMVVLVQDGPLVGWLRATGCAVAVCEPDGVGRSVSRLKPDAVMSLGSRSHLLGGEAAEHLGVPAIWWQELTVRGRDHERRAEQLGAAAVACCTRVAALRQRARKPGLPVFVVSPGIETSEVVAREAEGQQRRDELGWSEHRIVGMVARLDPAKGQDRLLDAAPRIMEHRPDVRILVVGGAIVGHEDGFEDVVTRRVAALGDRVRLVGHTDDPIPWQAALDVSVNASEHEAFGLSVLESMALGRPVVATPTDGSSELLGDGRFGVLAGGDDQSLAAGIGRVLDDPVLAGELAGRARVAAERFTARRCAEAVAECVRSVLAGSSPPSGGAC